MAAAVAALWRLEKGFGSELQEHDGPLHQRLLAVKQEMAAHDVIGEIVGHHISHPAVARQQLLELAKEYDGVRRCRNFAVHGRGRGRWPAAAAAEVKATCDQQAAAAEEAARIAAEEAAAAAKAAEDGDDFGDDW